MYCFQTIWIWRIYWCNLFSMSMVVCSSALLISILPVGLVQWVGGLSCVDGAGVQLPHGLWYSVGSFPTGWHSLGTVNTWIEKPMDPGSTYVVYGIYPMESSGWATLIYIASSIQQGYYHLRSMDPAHPYGGSSSWGRPVLCTQFYTMGPVESLWGYFPTHSYRIVWLSYVSVGPHVSSSIW